MIAVRHPEDIYQARGTIQDGTFTGRWHFPFGGYRDPENPGFGALWVFNDDTLSPGATWPLHPHREIEVVTYCAGGEFLHADESGKGGVLKKGWVQHTTVGSGMLHSEINNSPDEPMRFIQMWFHPSRKGLKPSVEQKPVERRERTNRLLKLVSPDDSGALRISSDANVLASFLEKGKSLTYGLGAGRGGYLYVVEGGPVAVNGNEVEALGAARTEDEKELLIKALEDSELLLVDALLP
ncbi:MAG: pirin family protein [Deltaproteobacteria bacterium]|nr:pirin family protein [Deltaproteobacteria bacterium]MBZ0219573.1 pirin family protein [Deltaproteobacteria bacterium]